MKRILGLIALGLLLSLPAAAQQAGFQDSLLDRFVGDWILEGTIAGGESTHDVTARWVLGHQYLRFHDLAREKDENGAPAYEAIVFIGWDQPSERYACLWLDSTGGGGLAARAIGHAEPDDDVLAFVFEMADDALFRTTFAYSRDDDAWAWHMDIESDGNRTPFARLSMTR